MKIRYAVMYAFWQAGLQALHFAAKAGHLEVASLLLDNGASVNATSSVILCLCQ